MKIRITENGFYAFNGELAGVQFKNGVSTEHLSRQQVNTISASMRCENIDEESDENVGVAESIAAGNDTEAPVVVPLNRGNEDAVDVPVDDQTVESVSEDVPVVQEEIEITIEEQPPLKKYSVEELEAVADKEGIAGLRAIGDDIGVKDNSISGLIREIMKARGE